MRTLIFSDSHLSLPFDKKKYNFLKKLIKTVEHVIINGDFWEGYEITFEQFINSLWKNLFPLLKSKKTVYIFGNHDKKILSDERISLFSIQQTKQYKLKQNNKILIFEHGNRICPFYDDIWKIKKTPSFLTRLIHIFTYIMIRIFKKKFIKYIYSRFNKVIKNKIKKEFNDNQILICGHTHFAEFNLKENFINTGFVNHGLAQYLIIDEEKITPKEEWYNP